MLAQNLARVVNYNTPLLAAFLDDGFVFAVFFFPADNLAALGFRLRSFLNCRRNVRLLMFSSSCFSLAKVNPPIAKLPLTNALNNSLVVFMMITFRMGKLRRFRRK